jgi:hypothetical protein
MADDKSNADTQDRIRINVHEDYELRDWSTRLGVTPEELKRVVAEVGPLVKDVEARLAK